MEKKKSLKLYIFQGRVDQYLKIRLVFFFLHDFYKIIYKI